MVATAPPADQGSKEATFTALATEFSFDDKVKRLFLVGQMETLEDFRYYFAEEKALDFVIKGELGGQGSKGSLFTAFVNGGCSFGHRESWLN